MIDVNKILRTDVLDIIFDGRNKDYGAYELRMNYKKRLGIAVISMITACGMVVLLSSFDFSGDDGPKKTLVVTDTNFQDFKKDEPEPPIVEPPKPKEQQVAIKQFTPPVIVKETQPDETPPPIEELQDTKIGTINQEGLKDDGIIAPPITDDGKGVIELPKEKEENWDKTFLVVQIESSYPGGDHAWKRYLERNMRYSQDAIDNNIQGTVVVQFIVDKDGNVSDVEAVSGPEELRAEAVRVIRKSGKWTPAIQMGRNVKSYKRQPVKFELADEN